MKENAQREWFIFLFLSYFSFEHNADTISKAIFIFLQPTDTHTHIYTEIDRQIASSHHFKWDERMMNKKQGKHDATLTERNMHCRRFTLTEMDFKFIISVVETENE